MDKTKMKSVSKLLILLFSTSYTKNTNFPPLLFLFSKEFIIYHLKY